jgi:multidrug efflux pump subunit AcrB
MEPHAAFFVRQRWPLIGLALLACVGGLLALLRLPVQLLPDVEAPTISIWTNWPGAAASEVERAITEPQETAMRGLQGLQEISATANAGYSGLELTFAPGTDLDPVFMEVIGRLQRVPALPRDASPPVINRGSDGPERTLIYYFVQLLPGHPGPIESHQAMLQREMLPRLERIPGVASARINAGPDRELRIDVDPLRMAELGIELPALVQTLSALDDVSAGAVELGRTAYALRLHGRFDPAALDEIAVGRIAGRTVRLSEIGSARFTRPDRAGFSYQNGNPALAVQLFREPGSNVLATIDALDAEIETLKATVLTPAGLDVRKSFEPGIFIRRAVGFLLGNLGIGLLAALACLYLFLRDLRATLLIALAVPVSLLTTTLLLAALGRSLNIISIAGLAFAIGMVMDAAIVVVEASLQQRAAGRDWLSATITAAARVRGALIAATATTVAVFLPVLALKDVEGQVFADLALTIAIAVMVSLAVALWIVPALLPLLARDRAPQRDAWAPLAARLAMLSAAPHRALPIALVLAIAPLLLAAWLMPPRDYLPPVKRAAVDAFIQTPPGMGAERLEAEIVAPIIERMRPYMRGDLEPKLLNYFVITWPGGATIGARVVDPARIGELETLLNNNILAGLPDVRAFAAEGELFGGMGGSARAVLLNVRGAHLGELRAAADALEAALKARYPTARVQQIPNAAAAGREIAVVPNDAALAERGLSRAWLADALRVLGDGRFVGEYFDGERRVPMRIVAPNFADLDALIATPLATPAGNAALGELASVELLRLPSELRRVNFARAITVTIDPPAEQSLESVLATLTGEVLPSVSIAPGVSIEVAGSASRLDALTLALAENLGMALLVLAVILMLLLRRVDDVLVVLATLPLAALGGVLGLRVLGWFTPAPLDLLTMIGFVMLLAMVVSNGVLLVEAVRATERSGATLDAAIGVALAERLRPLALGALTGVVGALPLAVSPGPAASIYRGLAAVTCGGVLLSLLLVAVLVPAALRVLHRFRGATDVAPMPFPMTGELR